MSTSGAFAFPRAGERGSGRCQVRVGLAAAEARREIRGRFELRVALKGDFHLGQGARDIFLDLEHRQLGALIQREAEIYL